VAVSFRSAFLKPSCSLSCSLQRLGRVPSVSFFVLFRRAQQMAGSCVRGCDILVACGRDPGQRTRRAGRWPWHVLETASSMSWSVRNKRQAKRRAVRDRLAAPRVSSSHQTAALIDRRAHHGDGDHARRMLSQTDPDSAPPSACLRRRRRPACSRECRSSFRVADWRYPARHPVRRVCWFPRSRLNPPPGSEMVMQAACLDELRLATCPSRCGEHRSCRTEKLAAAPIARP
jgi:hypothetical protein